MNKNFFYRSFELDRAVVDTEKRTASLSFSSEAPVRRWFGNEILLHGAENVDLSRLQSMGSVLMNHDPRIIVGPVTKAEIQNGRGMAEMLFDDDDDGNRCMKKVKSGSLRGVSCGYQIQKFREVMDDEEYELPDGRKITGPAYVATRWTPYEISLTPIPADASVGVGRSETRSLDGIEIERSTPNKEGNTMTDEEIKKLVRDAVSGALPEVTKAAVTAVREAIAEEGRPKMRISTEELSSLLGRAGAFSLELKAEVADLATQGKTREEITDHIMVKAAGKPDAKGKNGPGADGTGRDSKPGTQAGARGTVTSFSQVPDDDNFFRSLTNPSAVPMQ